MQIFAGVRAAGRTADDANHFIDVVERDLVTEQNVFALFGFAQLILRATTNYVDAVRDKKLKQFD